MNDLTDAVVLIVDDEPSNCILLERILKGAGFADMRSVTDSTSFWDVFERTRPDLVLLDLHMPQVDGFQILTGLSGLTSQDDFLPVIVLTADISADTRQRALALGARDYLTKPFDATEALQRVTNLLHTRSLTLRLRDQNRVLEERVKQRTAALAAANIETVQRLALAAEYRDDDTGDHIRSVGELAGAIATEVGLTSDAAELIRVAAPLHDIGKIAIPDSILSKTGALTDAEIVTMRRHAQLGANVLAGAETPLLEVARKIALTHHERWDGGGYPNGLAGNDIPLPGRITAVADVYDALTRERPYKRAWEPDRAIDEIIKSAGSHFDPDVVRAFASLYERGEVVPRDATAERVYHS